MTRFQQDIARQADESLRRSRERRAKAKRTRRIHIALSVLTFALVCAVFATLIILFPR